MRDLTGKEANAIVMRAGGILGFRPATQSLMFADDFSGPVAPSFEGTWTQPPPGCEALIREATSIDEIVRLARRMDALFPAPVTFLGGGIELDGQGFRTPGVHAWSAKISRERGGARDERAMEIVGFSRLAGEGQRFIDDNLGAQVLDIARAYARWGFHAIRARAPRGLLGEPAR